MRRRRRALLVLFVLLVLLLALRAAIPTVARAILERQLSDAIAGSVEIDDVDLWLLRTAVALDGVRVIPEEDGEAAIAWERFYVRIRPGGLLRGALHLDEVRLESPELRIDREPDGSISLAALLPPAESPSPEEEASAAAPEIDVDRLVVERGRIIFHDRAVAAETSPVDVELSRIHVERLSMLPDFYEKPARLSLEAKIEDAPVTIEATATRSGEDWTIEAQVSAEGIPLRRVRTYLPQTGWSELRGRLDADVEYRLDPSAKTHAAKGDLSLRDLEIVSGGIEQPALSWKSLAVAVDEVSLADRAIRVASIRLDGARLVIDPAASTPLPLLGTSSETVPSTPPNEDREGDDPPAAEAPKDSPAADPAPGEPDSTAAVVPEAPASTTGTPTPVAAPEEAQVGDSPPEDTAPPGEEWIWRIEAIELESATLFLAAESPVEIGLAATLEGLDPSATTGFPMQATATTGDGSLRVEGTAHLTAPHFRGRVEWSSIDLPPLLATTGAPILLQIRSGTTSGALTLDTAEARKEGGDPEPGLAAVTGMLRVAGELGLRSFQLRSDAPPPAVEPDEEGDEEEAEEPDPEFSLELPELDVAITSLLLDQSYRPAAVSLGRVGLAAPRLRLMRDASGFVLPVADEPEDGAPTATPPPSAEAPESTPSRPAAADTPELRIAAIEIDGGRSVLVDRTTKPFFREELRDLRLRLRELAWPDGTFASIDLAAVVGEKGNVAIQGEQRDGAMSLRVSGTRVALPPLNPYLSTLSDYSVFEGSLSVDSGIEVAGARVETSNTLVLHDFDLGGGRGESLFEKQYGVSLSLGLALLRDVGGNITLEFPVAVERGEAEIGIASVIRSALQRAVLNALVSPLKLLGAVTLGGGKVEAVAPEPVPFVSGTDRFRRGASDRIQSIARLLAERPALTLELRGGVDAADVRRLGEQALLEELQAGVESGEKRPEGPQERIREYLEARREGRRASLPEAEQGMLESLLAARRVSPGALRALADARAGRVRSRLVESHGIAGERLTLSGDEVDPTAGPRGVAIGVGVRD